jgi:hypothetical protein
MPVQSLVTSRVTRVPGAVVMPPNLLNAQTGGLSFTQEPQMARAYGKCQLAC